MIDEGAITAAAAYVRDLLAGEASGHGVDHALRVCRTAAAIARSEGADVGVCRLAALLHDVDDHKLFPGTSASLAHAVSFLDAQGVEGDERHRVCQAIREVSFSANGMEPPSSLEAACVRDADRLDAIGALGVGRAFAFGGAHGRALWDESGECRDTTVAHFEDKLLLLAEGMSTQAGRLLAAGRGAYLRGFYEEFVAEWRGER